MLADLAVRDLLAAFSSKEPTPGGGSASALASAVGASLLMMVAALPKTRANTDDERAALAAAGTVLADLRERLTTAIDADSDAYDQVVAAYRRPKADEGEQAARQAAIQDAMRGAIDVPLSVLRFSAAALDQAVIVATHGHRAAVSDVGVAVALLRAGARGARLNVAINTGSVTDRGYADAVAAEVSTWSGEIARAADAADALLL